MKQTYSIYSAPFLLIVNLNETVIGDVRRGHGGGGDPDQQRGLPRREHPHPHHEASAARVPAGQGHAPRHTVRPHRTSLRKNYIIVKTFSSS